MNKERPMLKNDFIDEIQSFTKLHKVAQSSKLAVKAGP